MPAALAALFDRWKREAHLVTPSRASRQSPPRCAWLHAHPEVRWAARPEGALDGCLFMVSLPPPGAKEPRRCSACAPRISG